MESIVNRAIQVVQNSSIAFTKFITPNDVGATGGHQSGFHIHKNSWKLFFDTEGAKGSNKDLFITIKWQDDFETSSRFIYYGTGTRNEYRLTRFGKGFPFLEDENIGDLLIICKQSDTYYNAYILNTEEEIEEFLAALNISSSDTNGIIPAQFGITTEKKLHDCFIKYLLSLKIDFPSTIDIAARARSCFNSSYNFTDDKIIQNPDSGIINWLDAEFQLFKVIEMDRYKQRISTPFKSIDELVKTANTLLNRRKSRAGHSLEHHLSEIFKIFKIKFETQVITEDKKKPDFLFPGAKAYYNKNFNEKKLITLASKTTCKDRWRQILNEADRVKTKHLFTLQQGISQNQLAEMFKYNVQLIVPEGNLVLYPKSFRHKILTLKDFIHVVQKNQL